MTAYVDTRAAQGFTVIQTVAIFPQAGGPGPHRYGDQPFRGGLPDLVVTDGADPDDGAQYDYWDHLDFIVAAATERGLRVGPLPVWADQQVGDLVTAQNAGSHGEFLGARHADDQIVCWFDPRSGAATEIGIVPTEPLDVTPPIGEDLVFVADDAGRGLGAPGAPGR